MIAAGCRPMIPCPSHWRSEAAAELLLRHLTMNLPQFPCLCPSRRWRQKTVRISTLDRVSTAALRCLHVVGWKTVTECKPVSVFSKSTQSVCVISCQVQMYVFRVSRNKPPDKRAFKKYKRHITHSSNVEQGGTPTTFKISKTYNVQSVHWLTFSLSTSKSIALFT